MASVYWIGVHPSSAMVARARFTAGSIRTVTDTSAPVFNTAATKRWE
jgi:hypothetical protein